jgi:hypothetical protein
VRTMADSQVKCGQAIEVIDFYGAPSITFHYVCQGAPGGDGHWLIVNRAMTWPPSGSLLQADAILRELVALAVPRKLTEHARTVRGTDSAGLYIGFPLTFPLPVGDLARLLRQSSEHVREQLSDMAVQADG